MFDAHAEAERLGQHGVVLVKEQRRDSSSHARHEEVLGWCDQLVVLGGKSCRGNLFQVEGELLLGFFWVDFRAGEVVGGLWRLRGELEFVYLIHFRTVFAFHGDLFVVLAEGREGQEGQGEDYDISFHCSFRYRRDLRRLLIDVAPLRGLFGCYLFVSKDLRRMLIDVTPLRGLVYSISKGSMPLLLLTLGSLRSTSASLARASCFRSLPL